MWKRIVLSLGTLALLGIAQASAADLPVKAPMAEPPAPFAMRWYVEGRLGAPLKKKYDIDLSFGTGTYEADTGLHAAFDVGVVFTPNWRAEFEVTWTEGKDGTVVTGGTNIPHTGKTTVWTFGVNGFYTFDVNWPVKPFVGAGIGLASYNVNNLGAVGGSYVVDDTQTAAVFALHAGLDVPITPSIALTGRYTYAYTTAMTFGSVPAGSPVSRHATGDNIFTGGVRVYLN